MPGLGSGLRGACEGPPGTLGDGNGALCSTVEHLLAAFMDRRFARAQREARILEASEARYRRIFDTAAGSIWDEDFSAVVDAIETLRAQGVRDFKQYFDEHPEFVTQAVGLVRVRDVNPATLALFEAHAKAELLASLPRVFLPETLAVFRDELLAIAAGATSFNGTAPAQTLRGRRIEVVFSMIFPADDPRLESVLVSLRCDRAQARRGSAARGRAAPAGERAALPPGRGPDSRGRLDARRRPGRSTAGHGAGDPQSAPDVLPRPAACNGDRQRQGQRHPR
jgi:PAS domain-containing protein